MLLSPASVSIHQDCIKLIQSDSKTFILLQKIQFQIDAVLLKLSIHQIILKNNLFSLIQDT